MSTKTVNKYVIKKKILAVCFIILFIFSFDQYIRFSLKQEVYKSWEVIAIFKNDLEISKNYKRLRFVVLNDGELILPRKDLISANGFPIKYSKHKIQLSLLYECTFTIEDKTNEFSGKYNIQKLSFNPLVLQLNNTTTRILLKEKKFTLENPSMKIDWQNIVK